MSKKRLDIAKLRKLKQSDVIAQREYQLTTRGGKKGKVVARFGRPRPMPDAAGIESYCIFQIDGLDETSTPEFAPGVDSVQALHCAMQMAWSRLITSEAYREGRLSFWGIPDLGLPPLYFKIAEKDAKYLRGHPALQQPARKTDSRARANRKRS
jgi:hypothetical protein